MLKAALGPGREGPHLDVLEHVRMVADFPQLHDGVHQGLGAAFALQRKKRVPHRVLSQAGVGWVVERGLWKEKL